MSDEAIQMVMQLYNVTETEALFYYYDEIVAVQKVLSMKALDELADQAQELGVE